MTGDLYDEQTALLVVDVQNDFADPGGNLYVSEGESIVGSINAEIDAALRSGASVFYTQDWHPGATPHFAKDGGTWPVHCVMDSWGAQLHPDLKVVGEVVRKGADGSDGYSGFSIRHPETGRAESTSLEGLLRARRIRRVVVVGLATDYCVKETALDALDKGFETVVLRRCVRGVDVRPGDSDRALEEIVRATGKVE